MFKRQDPKQKMSYEMQRYSFVEVWNKLEEIGIATQVAHKIDVVCKVKFVTKKGQKYSFLNTDNVNLVKFNGIIKFSTFSIR